MRPRVPHGVWCPGAKRDGARVCTCAAYMRLDFVEIKPGLASGVTESFSLESKVPTHVHGHMLWQPSDLNRLLVSPSSSLPPSHSLMQARETHSCMHACMHARESDDDDEKP
eukprot:GHVU01017968.1.p1 GENE.GHVU01017968.1~~GHVU01017968.1.p1  ORF type:complete len:112 (-),score=0.69 GHVU01017968.1:584-919(-)